jgi:hypothetical protein
MKKSIQFFGLCLLGMSVHICAIAQQTDTDDSIVLKKRIYKVSIITADSKRNTGYLASLSDSNLYLSPHPLHFSLLKINDNLAAYPYTHLEKIVIKRKAAAGRGAWQGALFGLAAGAITGFASGDDPVVPTNNSNDPFGNVIGGISNSFRMTAGEKAVAGGFVGAVTGSLIGVLVGSLAQRKFLIGRNKQRFHEMRQNIVEKLYMHREEKLQSQK